MTMQTQLNITEYFIKDLSLKVNQDIDNKTAYKGKIPINLALEIKEKNASDKVFMVTIELTYGEIKKKIPVTPFYLYFSIDGFFTLVGDPDKNEKKNLMHLNAPSILYGIVRGIIGHITSNTKLGKLIIPAVNFVEILKRGKVKNK
ncbi:MAG: protein-export chaperone SecB [Proteobacteria bacterium]|nr:protein-export chaperone SecB [Pseudomonadota bacterium]